MKRGKRGERLTPFPSFHCPARAYFIFFLIFAIFIGIPSGSLCGGDSVMDTAYQGYPGDSIQEIVISTIIWIEPHHTRSVSIIMIFSIA